MNQWKIGDVKISRIVESEAIWDGTFLLPNATAVPVLNVPSIVEPMTTDCVPLAVA